MTMADYIDRKALLAHLYSKQDEPVDMALEIAQFPAADVAPVRHGRRATIEGVLWRCTACGCASVITAVYCPHCGAKMDGDA